MHMVYIPMNLEIDTTKIKGLGGQRRLVQRISSGKMRPEDKWLVNEYAPKP
jgi:hypothetical protein